MTNANPARNVSLHIVFTDGSHALRCDGASVDPHYAMAEVARARRERAISSGVHLVALDQHGNALWDSRTAVKNYRCRDRECHEREASGRPCPWCWGGYPSK